MFNRPPTHGNPDSPRAGDQAVGLEQPVNRGFGHEVALLVGEPHRQFPGARRAFIEEAAGRRDLTQIIIEKNFWVCRTLRRLTTAPALKDHITFKGGTSLSKAYGIIERFSEDIGTNERKRRTRSLKQAA